MNSHEKNLKLYEIGMVESMVLFWLCSRAQRRWTLNTTKAHSIFGTHHKQMDCFWKASLHDMIPLCCLYNIHCQWWMVAIYVYIRLSEYMYSNKLSCLASSQFWEVSSHTTVIKTSGSESRGQEEAACIRILRPMRPLQWVICTDGRSKFLKCCSSAAITAIA